MSRVEHLILTGADGYLGTGLVALALSEGRRVTILSRRDGPGPVGVRRVAWCLGEALPAAALAPDLAPTAQALVHLAHDWRDPCEDANVNLTGALALRAGARAAGLRSVFISSQSARPDALNRYGRLKWRIEQAFGEAALSLRVGLVYGGPRIAMYGLLCRLTGLGPALPMIEPGKPVQPIHRDEVARGILNGLDRGLTGVLGLAGPEPVPFGTVLATLARVFAGRRLRVLPVPLRLALLGCRAVNAVPLLPRIDRERVLGLAGTRAMPCADDLGRLGLSVAPLGDGLLREPAARRALLAEGRTLLRYVLRAEPGPALLRRYVRALARSGPPEPLLLADALRTWPSLIRFVEPLGGTAPLTRRLALATRLAEASLDGERALARHGRPSRLARLAADLAVDCLALPLRLAARRR